MQTLGVLADRLLQRSQARLGLPCVSLRAARRVLVRSCTLVFAENPRRLEQSVARTLFARLDGAAQRFEQRLELRIRYLRALVSREETFALLVVREYGLFHSRPTIAASAALRVGVVLEKRFYAPNAPAAAAGEEREVANGILGRVGAGPGLEQPLHDGAAAMSRGRGQNPRVLEARLVQGLPPAVA
eukprot:scaffold36089_cov59-Phaeocystis_antarctica.AAC.3